jgi:CubicO group peptidase (beta-lactamase class C family)
MTATAVLQLVEQGKLDLDRDVNEYLDFRIRSLNGSPITVRHLLTHSAGFDQTVKGLGYLDPKLVLPLSEYIKRYVPPTVYAPGTTSAYSNYGFVLAGYLVQRISGEPFEDYIDRHIFQPLGMTRSTFRQPPPPPLDSTMS